MTKQASTPVPAGTPRGSFNVRSLLGVNTLLIFIPIALLLRASGGSDVAIFLTSGLAIIPLAGLIGTATEVIAAKLGPSLGGLINATLGNAAELIITIFALRAGLVELVKASLVGSILGNLLLILGLSLLVGGLKHGVQTFEKRAASVNATLVILAFLALVIPTAFDSAILAGEDGAGRELLLSEGIGLVMIVLYGLYILYTLRQPKTVTGHELGEAAEALHHAEMSMSSALIMLAAATLGIVFMSETLVGTVEAVGASIGLSEFFIGIIIVPLIGNVAEHLVAIQVAYKNRMDLSLGISLGSSLQIALFVAPVLVFVSLLFTEKLVLVFNPYELLALATASLVAALVSQDGESNWLEGAMLLAVYIIFGFGFFLLPAIGEPHSAMLFMR